MATVSGNLPGHIQVAARTGVLMPRPNAASMPWRQIAMDIDLTAASTTFVDFGGLPLPTRDPQVIQDIVERSKTVEPVDWYLTVELSQNAIDDDQTGQVLNKFRNLSESFDRHINKQVFTVLNAGDTTTYGKAYDGSDFFDNDHVDESGSYTTPQDNEETLELTPDNFNTVYGNAQLFVDDQGNYAENVFDLLVVHPTKLKIATQITGNPSEPGTANNDLNVYQGRLKPPVTSPYLDSSAWYLIASSQSAKPLYVAMRKRPVLIGTEFQPQAEEGGMWRFTYHGRYVVGYGDWRLAMQGNT